MENKCLLYKDLFLLTPVKFKIRIFILSIDFNSLTKTCTQTVKDRRHAWTYVASITLLSHTKWVTRSFTSGGKLRKIVSWGLHVPFVVPGYMGGNDLDHHKSPNGDVDNMISMIGLDWAGRALLKPSHKCIVCYQL